MSTSTCISGCLIQEAPGAGNVPAVELHVDHGDTWLQLVGEVDCVVRCRVPVATHVNSSCDSIAIASASAKTR